MAHGVVDQVMVDKRQFGHFRVIEGGAMDVEAGKDGFDMSERMVLQVRFRIGGFDLQAGGGDEER